MIPEDKEDRITYLKERVADFPQLPGVYLMKNRQDKVIYVGKAKKLRNRVRSYFNKNQENSKTQLLVHNICGIDYILTETEAEAFLLEASLIKKYRPRYNIRLKDDKSYPYIRLSLADEFPRFYRQESAAAQSAQRAHLHGGRHRRRGGCCAAEHFRELHL